MNKTSIPNINNKSKYHKKSKAGINKKAKKPTVQKPFSRESIQYLHIFYEHDSCLFPIFKRILLFCSTFLNFSVFLSNKQFKFLFKKK